MIKTLIFDFGDVFINLDKEAPHIEMEKLGITSFSEEMLQTNINYETGKISSKIFLKYYTNKFPNISSKELEFAWNSIILDFPDYRLEFIEKIARSNKYQLILLSNTNDLHIKKVNESMGLSKFKRFKKCFDNFYLSQEIHLRKPNSDIYNFVLNTHNLFPNECLFIDDTLENTKSAKQIGIHTWTINPKTEDIIDLFRTRKELF